MHENIMTNIQHLSHTCSHNITLNANSLCFLPFSTNASLVGGPSDGAALDASAGVDADVDKDAEAYVVVDADVDVNADGSDSVLMTLVADGNDIPTELVARKRNRYAIPLSS